LTYRIRKRALARASLLGAATLALTPVIALAGDSGGLGTVPAAETADGAFPIKGKHSYGDGIGAGRGHQGQDLMAKCGKPVVAAQPGRVKFTDYQASGAGHYVVIDGKGALEDTVYMHLKKPAKVRKRQAISPGDLIGRVGTTGRSSACHLHFEMWDGPGWYDGGSPIDPKPFLRALDRKRRG
jgi:murein DD-endopeptidase MepM/ murein hydrolase activator NlpD